ncbi:MAG: pseudouridine synthase [Nonlabens sp.]
MHRHFLVYKPYKMVSQFITNDHKQKRKRFLGELHDFPANSMAVGRLDENSEGLIIITTNGKLSNQINKSALWEKTYNVQLDGIVEESHLEKLKSCVTITVNSKAYTTKPCAVELIKQPTLRSTQQRIRDDRHGPTSWISITITEGKFRQVRKMCAAVGLPVLRLVRVKIGQLDMGMMDEKVVIELDDSLLFNNY